MANKPKIQPDEEKDKNKPIQEEEPPKFGWDKVRQLDQAKINPKRYSISHNKAVFRNRNLGGHR